MGEHPDQRHRQQQTEHRAQRPHHSTLHQKHPQHLAPRGAHGAQDADLAALLHHRHHQHTGNAQHHHRQHHTPDDGGADGLRVERGHQLGIALLPALDLVGELALQLSRQGLGHPNVLEGQVQLGDSTGQRQQALRGTQRHDHGAPVQVFHAQVHQRGHAHRVADCSAHTARLHREAVAHAHPQVLRQLAAYHRLAWRQPRTAADDLGAQAHHTVIAVQFHPHEGNGL